MAGFSSSRFAFFKFARVNRKLPHSTRSGVTCHPSTRRRRRRAFDFYPSGSMQQRHKRKEGEEHTAEPQRQHHPRGSRWRY